MGDTQTIADKSTEKSAEKPNDPTTDSLGKAFKGAGGTFADSPVGACAVPCPKKAPDVPSGCRFLTPGGGHAMAGPSAYERGRKKSGAAKISKPTETTKSWRKGDAPSKAMEKDVVIDGQTIKVYYPPKDQADGKNLATPEQVAESLRAMPADQRANTKEVIISPEPSKDPVKPGEFVGGDAGAGAITLYPNPNPQGPNYYDNRMMHEQGHNYQGALWDDPDKVKEWGDAAAKDGNHPSEYAKSNFGDDFCEFLIYYNAAKGTPCEASLKEIYPNRYAKMESYQKQK